MGIEETEHNPDDELIDYVREWSKKNCMDVFVVVNGRSYHSVSRQGHLKLLIEYHKKLEMLCQADLFI